MLWLAWKLSGKPGSEGRKPLTLAACACARLALKRVPKGENRPRRVIVTAERWARGKATLDEVRMAAADAAADAAYDAAYADAAAYAAAGQVMHRDADAAAYAAYAAYAAADAAYADAYYADAARATSTRAECADIVRKFYPRCPLPVKGGR